MLIDVKQKLISPKIDKFLHRKQMSDEVFAEGIKFYIRHMADEPPITWFKHKGIMKTFMELFENCIKKNTEYFFNFRNDARGKGLG